MPGWGTEPALAQRNRSRDRYLSCSGKWKARREKINAHTSSDKRDKPATGGVACDQPDFNVSYKGPTREMYNMTTRDEHKIEPYSSDEMRT